MILKETTISILYFLLFLIFPESYSEENCAKGENGKCFIDYKNKINKELQPNLIEKFDEILEKYNKLEDEINKLNDFDSWLNDLNNQLEEQNKANNIVAISNNNLENKIKKVITLLHEVKNLNFNDFMSFDEYRKLLNKTSTGDFVIDTKYLDKLIEIIEKLLKINPHVTNLPHSIQSDIKLIENLLGSKDYKDCLNKMSGQNEKLNKLYEEANESYKFANKLKQLKEDIITEYQKNDKVNETLTEYEEDVRKYTKQIEDCYAKLKNEK